MHLLNDEYDRGELYDLLHSNGRGVKEGPTFTSASIKKLSNYSTVLIAIGIIKHIR